MENADLVAADPPIETDQVSQGNEKLTALIESTPDVEGLFPALTLESPINAEHPVNDLNVADTTPGSELKVQDLGESLGDPEGQGSGFREEPSDFVVLQRAMELHEPGDEFEKERSAQGSQAESLDEKVSGEAVEGGILADTVTRGQMLIEAEGGEGVIEAEGVSGGAAADDGVGGVVFGGDDVTGREGSSEGDRVTSRDAVSEGDGGDVKKTGYGMHAATPGEETSQMRAETNADELEIQGELRVAADVDDVNDRSENESRADTENPHVIENVIPLRDSESDDVEEIVSEEIETNMVKAVGSLEEDCPPVDLVSEISSNSVLFDHFPLLDSFSLFLPLVKIPTTPPQCLFSLLAPFPGTFTQPGNFYFSSTPPIRRSLADIEVHGTPVSRYHHSVRADPRRKQPGEFVESIVAGAIEADDHDDNELLSVPSERFLQERALAEVAAEKCRKWRQESLLREKRMREGKRPQISRFNGPEIAGVKISLAVRPPKFTKSLPPKKQEISISRILMVPNF